MLEISIEEMKKLAAKIATELNRDHEPLEEIKQTISLLDQLLQGSIFKNPKTEEYFLGEFLGEISKNALKSFHFKTREVIHLYRM